MVDENDVHGLESALSALARQLAEQAGPLKEFDKALDEYRRSVQAAADRVPEPSAGGGTASLPSRIVTQAAFGAASMLPGGGVVATIANPDNVALGADRLIAGMRQRRRGNDGEEAVLSRAFVAELEKLCGRDGRWVVLFLDTWEQTDRHLGAWLRELLDGAYGSVPLDVMVVLAGREELSERDWDTLRPAVVDVPLDVFTDQETRELLAVRGVTDPEVVEAVTGLSMRLPLLVALLAQTGLQAVGDVSDAGADLTDHAVERFLQWIPEQERRETVLAAALPLQLNHDLFACAVPGAAGGAWDWLLSQPFVLGHGSYWQYHPVVRASLLRRRRMHSPTDWAAAHGRLAEQHRAAREALEQEGPEQPRWRGDQWCRLALHETYHLLCANPTANLAHALEHVARLADRNLAGWVDMLGQAAQVSEDRELDGWARRLHAAVGTEDPETHALTALCAPGLPPVVRARALAERGDNHFRADRDEDALVDLDCAVAISPGLPEARAYRARVHLANNRKEQALADLTAALDLDPEYSWAWVLRGVAWLESGRPDEAVADCATALSLNPNSTGALSIRGRAHLEAGRPDEAVADLTAVGLTPRVQAYRGRAHLDAGRLDEAVADFTAALASDSRIGWARAYRGEAHQRAGRPDEAVADFTEALTLNPGDGWVLVRRGEAHLLADRLDEAVVDFTAVLELKPRYWRALLQRGLAYWQAGLLDEALADLNAAVELDSENGRVIGFRGEVNRTAGRLDEARADCAAALELDPENAWLLGIQGLTKSLSGQLDSAAVDLSRALSGDPESVWILCALTAVHRRSGRIQEAWEVLRRAAEVDAADSSVLWETAMMRIVESGRVASLAAWNEYLDVARASGEAVDSAAAELLHGLVVQDTAPDALVHDFLAVPRTGAVLVDVRMGVEELARMEDPVGPRAEAALRLLRAPAAP
ncbi:tetratricopeptide repeat protein [Kitasatospora sp. NPDC057542]|uniref:tetratricopeptide repeat protein n=1 Tax=Kitasatospora sp. NPDC057542 TaxID=3346162 RepID=UPI003676F113